MNKFRQTTAIRISIKQRPIFFAKSKFTDSKKEDFKEKIRIKTPIGKVK